MDLTSLTYSQIHHDSKKAMAALSNRRSVNSTGSDITHWNLSGIDRVARNAVNSSVDVFDVSKEHDIVRLTTACTFILLCFLVTVGFFHYRKNPSFSNFAVVAAIVFDTATSLVHMGTTWVVGQQVNDTAFNSSFCCASWVAVLLTAGWPLWSVFVVSYDRLDNAVRPFNRRLTPYRAGIIAIAIVTGSGLCCVILMTTTLSKPALVSYSQNTCICVLYATGGGLDGREAAFTIVYYVVSTVIPTILSAVYFARLIWFAWQKMLPVTWSPEEGTLASHRVTALVKTRGFICIVAIFLCKVIFVIPARTVLVLQSHYMDDISPSLVLGFMELANTHSAFTSVLYVVWLKTKSYPTSSHDVLSFVHRRPTGDTHAARRQSNLESNAATAFSTNARKSETDKKLERRTRDNHSVVVASKKCALNHPRSCTI